MIARAGRWAVIITCLAGPALPMDAEGRYAVEGMGRMACSAFVALEPGSEALRAQAIWISGYITAHNRLMPETFDLSSWQTPNTQLALIGQYCRANPDATVETGAREMVQYLRETRLAAPSEAVTMGRESATVVVYAEIVRRAIDALGAAGHPLAAPEGLADALRGYQAENGLEATGLLDQATLARLLN